MLYKYLAKEYAYLLLTEGKLRLGTQDDFRCIEKHGSIRGDDSESIKSSCMYIRNEFWTSHTSPAGIR